jgi:beta-galactosidase/beta-glucuronidase
MPGSLAAQAPSRITLSSGWTMQAQDKVSATGDTISSAAFKPTDWYPAAVPGTVLTTLVNNKVYPEPLYGENNRPEIIPDTLARQSFWYRQVVTVPAAYAGRHIWLNFEGINYSSVIWVNGTQVGTTRGAFIRGRFDISATVKPGTKAVIAVLVSPQPHPGTPHEHTLRAGIGPNGGITAIDGPTFLSTIGWDWLPAIRDRDTGIWQQAYLSATGPGRIEDPLITTDLPLPSTASTDIAIQARVENITEQPHTFELSGTIDAITFHRTVKLEAHTSSIETFDPSNTPALHLLNPRLWWPNGYGPQNLYNLKLILRSKSAVSDAQTVPFGVRKITYTVPDTENLTISVNGVRVFIRGGNWGLDEALKRIPRERLEAQIRMHQLAHMNLIRNWVGQSTNEDFYQLCDKYGILLWDEFFQPNPGDGPNPDDLATYMANVRDKILRYRNHPSIAIWCARNEGYPPKEIDDALRVLMAELEPTRLYQPSSTDGHGVASHGPYHWREPRKFYEITEAFKTETGSVSVPTLESIQGMMPEKDWSSINDDWAEHDFAKGNSGAETYPATIAARYGEIANLADFVRKSQLANYEAYRAMYEGRNAQLFHPTTAVITWMSNPAQPSFVWQLYHYDLEPNASLFAVQKASELQHIQYNEATGDLQVINNLPTALTGASAKLTIYNLDGSIARTQTYTVTAPAAAATNLGPVTFADTSTQLLKLSLTDTTGKPLSDNLYWHASITHPDDLTALDNLPTATLTATISRKEVGTDTVLTVTLRNPTATPALMAHLQLHRLQTKDRVLPAFYSDNYVSLMPGESRTVTIAAARAQLKGEAALVLVDGWNVKVAPWIVVGAFLETNQNTQVDHWPKTGLPYQTENLR